MKLNQKLYKLKLISREIPKKLFNNLEQLNPLDDKSLNKFRPNLLDNKSLNHLVNLHHSPYPVDIPKSNQILMPM